MSLAHENCTTLNLCRSGFRLRDLFSVRRTCVTSCNDFELNLCCHETLSLFKFLSFAYSGVSQLILWLLCSPQTCIMRKHFAVQNFENVWTTSSFHLMPTKRRQSHHSMRKKAREETSTTCITFYHLLLSSFLQKCSSTKNINIYPSEQHHHRARRNERKQRTFTLLERSASTFDFLSVE